VSDEPIEDRRWEIEVRNNSSDSDTGIAETGKILV